MKNVIQDVKDFHTACGVPTLTSPQFPSKDRIKLRLNLIDEERQELTEALDDNDIVEVADALGDMIYVITGMALEFGIPLGPVWDEIQRSNMAKTDPSTGKVRRREDGKILKPEGWQPPDIKKALGL